MGLEFVQCDRQYWDFVRDLRNDLLAKIKILQSESQQTVPTA